MEIIKLKKAFYIIGDYIVNYIVKKLNGYLVTNKIKYKHLVKVPSFLGAKFNCMSDHVKSTLGGVHPDHTILHAGTNNLITKKWLLKMQKLKI